MAEALSLKVKHASEIIIVQKSGSIANETDLSFPNMPPMTTSWKNSKPRVFGTSMEILHPFSRGTGSLTCNSNSVIEFTRVSVVII